MVRDDGFKLLYKITAFLLGSMMLTAALTGCALENRPVRVPVSEKISQQVFSSAMATYPKKLRVLHHVILTLADKDYVLNGYLSVDREKKEIRLIAQNDLGGIVFDVHYMENEIHQVNSNLKSIREEWLETTLLRDLKTIYLFEPSPDDRIVTEQPESVIVYRQEGDDEKEFIFCPSNSPVPFRLQKIQHFQNQELYYCVTFDYTSEKNPGYPGYIFIEDTRMRYSLKINVLYLLP